MRVLIFGTFDRLHPGHLFVIREASKRGNLSIVVARDVNVEKIKGKKPHQNEHERMSVLRKEFPYANVILGDETDFLTPVRNLRPDLILLGYDQKLPPSVSENMLPCPVERIDGFEVERWKTSRL